MDTAARLDPLCRPVWMELDLDCLAHNLSEVRRAIGRYCRIIAVAKADAYGHGVAEIVPALFKAGADVVALGDLNEAISLRQHGHMAPLVVFGSYLPEQVAEAFVEHALTPTVWDVEGARAFSWAAREPMEVYLKIDTGFHRLGVLTEEAIGVARQIAALPKLRIGCLYTHFADPIGGPEFTQEQFARFTAAVDAIRAAGIDVPFACAASSAVVSTRPEMYLNAVDPGRLLYGFYYPSDPPVELDLRPVLRAVKSRVIQVKWVEPGSSVGYERTYRTVRRTRLGILPMGWSDGLSRHGNTTPTALVRGQRCPMIGAINIEHSIVDLTDVEGAQAGDEVVLIGKQGGETITLDEHARWAGVSEMEVVVRFGRTVPRVYIHGGANTFVKSNVA